MQKKTSPKETLVHSYPVATSGCRRMRLQGNCHNKPHQIQPGRWGPLAHLNPRTEDRCLLVGTRE